MKDDFDIIQKLSEYNSWWKTGKVPKELFKRFHRRDFYKLCERLDDRKILSITGLRRVGKTVLMYQLINFLLEEKKVLPENILFLTLEHPLWKTIEVTMEEIIRIYCNSTLNISLEDINPDNPVFIFLDEIQYHNDWELYLKTLYDRNLPLKFVISGSSSLHLLSKSSESLVGRVYPQLIFPFKFLEYSRYQCFQSNTDLKDLDDFNFRFRSCFKESYSKGNLRILMDFFNSSKKYWQNQKSKLISELNEYILKGGFPEYLNQNLRVVRQDLITYMDLILFRDIPQIFPRRNTAELKKLYFWIVRTSPHRTNYTNISNAMKMKRDTVRDYLKILETVFLLKTTELYSKSAPKRLRASVKMYVPDIGIQAAYDNYPLRIYDYTPALLGRITESMVADHLLRLKFDLEGGLKSEIYYWVKNKYEVDVVCELFQKPLPVEIKYQNKIKKSELRGIRGFLSEYLDAPFGLVISKESFEFFEEERLLVIPLWLFLTLI